MHNKLIFCQDDDWLATRLTPRKYYPPETFSTDTKASIYPSKWHPSLIKIPGVEGFNVVVGNYKSQRCLLVQLAKTFPFADNTRIFAKRRLANWNDVFNTWDIPILSQLKNFALKEVWNIIETAFFELDWDSLELELHWQYAISERSTQVLKSRVEKLNNFWDTGIVEFYDCETNLIITGISKEELEIEVYRVYKSFQWDANTKDTAMAKLCVDFLRHKKSAYHLLLNTDQAYLQTFKQINQAIASAYPWLKNEAMRQISIKELAFE